MAEEVKRILMPKAANETCFVSHSTPECQSSSRMTQPSIFRWQGQHNDKRSARTFKHTDWTALLKEAQILNGGRPCVFDGSYHAGGRHIVRRLEFINGGQLWLVRIPILPACSTLDQGEILKWWTAERRFTMESEIATMKYIEKFTDIPVPTIFGHSTSIDGNPVKLPYMLMQCIRGNMLFDLGGPGILTGEQKSRIRKSIASIQVCGTPSIVSSCLLLLLCLVSNGDCLDQQTWISCLGTKRDN